MTPTPRILCIGEAMAEIRSDAARFGARFGASFGASFAVGFAGDTFNTAVYCRRQLRGGTVGYLTRIGRDPLSEGFLRLAAREGLDLSAVGRDDRNLGIYAVQTDAAGERSFAYWRDRSAARTLFQTPADFAALEGAELLYLSGITLAILTPEARDALLTRLQALRAAGRRVAFDSNYRPALWPDAATARQVVGRAWALADIALPSLDDEMALFGDADAAAVLARLGPREGALKRGALGPLALRPAGTAGEFAPAARVVDTTAAGDSFNGGFLAALVQGADTGAAMAAGHGVARQVVAAAGAIVPTV